MTKLRVLENNLNYLHQLTERLNSTVTENRKVLSDDLIYKVRIILFTIANYSAHSFITDYLIFTVKAFITPFLFHFKHFLILLVRFKT